MKVLLVGVYWPRLGGMEYLLDTISRELSKTCAQVSILNLSRFTGEMPESIRRSLPVNVSIINRRGFYANLVLAKRHEICIMFGPSLHAYAALSLSGTPFIISLHTHLDKHLNIKERIKYEIVKKQSLVIACSKYISETTGVKSVVIGNSYSTEFADYVMANISLRVNTRSGVVFVGRLVSDKGCMLLLEALALLPESIRPDLTIIGDGPDKDRLHFKSLSLKLSVHFLGSLCQRQILSTLPAYDIMIIPSVWGEPFGIVALEGLACGCRLIVSDNCGLQEASGGFAKTFVRGNVHSLASALHELLIDPDSYNYHLHAPSALRKHLLNHSPSSVASAYKHFAAKCKRFPN